MKKKLNPEADLAQFIRSVERCTGEVLFTTEDGDCLNLKSMLSIYVFSMLADRRDLLMRGCVSCEREADMEALTPYLLGEAE